MNIDPIRIHHADSPEEVQARHARIEARLDDLGVDQVRLMQATGFPPEWGPIIRSFLKGERLKT